MPELPAYCITADDLTELGFTHLALDGGPWDEAFDGPPGAWNRHLLWWPEDDLRWCRVCKVVPHPTLPRATSTTYKFYTTRAEFLAEMRAFFDVLPLP